ncbi:hypothetical protein ABZP36_035909 [Zizania latifolia]
MEVTAVSLARSVLDGVLSGAGSAIADEAALLLGLRGEVDFIRKELEMMRSCLKVATANNPDADDIVRTWGKQVRELAYDVEDCLLDFALYADMSSSSGRLGAWLPGHLARRHRVAARILEINASVKELNERFQRYSIVVNHPRGGGGGGGGDQQQHQGVLPDHDAYSPELAALESDEEIRENDKKELIRENDEKELILIRENDKEKLTRLISGDSGNGAEPLGVVSVCGMGGMGKSSLMRMVYGDPELLDAFDCGAWVTVPHQLDSKEEFARRLRKHLSVALEPANEVPDDVRVLQKYLQKKRYVIIVDDLRSQEEWEYIWPVLNVDSKKGSSVVVTTRRKDVAQHCARQVPEGHGHIYELKPLGRDESERLFCQKVYKSPNPRELETDMKDPADKILK